MNHFYSDKSLKNDADSGRLCRPVSVEDMMEARERRARLQEQLIGTYQVPVVSFTLNIPGPVKILPGTEEFFRRGSESVRQALKQASVPILFETQLWRAGPRLLQKPKAHGGGAGFPYSAADGRGRIFKPPVSGCQRVPDRRGVRHSEARSGRSSGQRRPPGYVL